MFFISKKIGQGDEQIAQQCLHLLGLLAQQISIGSEVVHFMNLQSPGNPTQQSGAFVAGKIVSGADSEKRQNFA
jgi:hypothetical protein